MFLHFIFVVRRSKLLNETKNYFKFRFFISFFLSLSSRQRRRLCCREMAKKRFSSRFSVLKIINRRQRVTLLNPPPKKNLNFFDAVPNYKLFVLIILFYQSAFLSILQLDILILVKETLSLYAVSNSYSLFYLWTAYFEASSSSWSSLAVQLVSCCVYKLQNIIDRW